MSLPCRVRLQYGYCFLLSPSIQPVKSCPASAPSLTRAFAEDGLKKLRNDQILEMFHLSNASLDCGGKWVFEPFCRLKGEPNKHTKKPQRLPSLEPQLLSCASRAMPYSGAHLAAQPLKSPATCETTVVQQFIQDGAVSQQSQPRFW